MSRQRLLAWSLALSMVFSLNVVALSATVAPAQAQGQGAAVLGQFCQVPANRAAVQDFLAEATGQPVVVNTVGACVSVLQTLFQSPDPSRFFSSRLFSLICQGRLAQPDAPSSLGECIVFFNNLLK